MQVRFWFLILFLSCFPSVQSQGIYRDFGQNRVQYRQFNWDKLTFNNIDIVFYDDENVLANNSLQMAVHELERLETFLSYKYGGAMQIIVFSNLNDYRQSNIGYTNPQLSSGGFLVIPNDVSTVYFDGDYTHLQKQIRKAICDIMLREMIYGGTLQDRFERVRSPMLPKWFTEGLGAFLSESWSADLENKMLNAMGTNRFANFNNLTPEETVLAGQSIWRYIVEVYGAEALSTIVFIARYTHSVDAAVYFHTRKNMGEFLREWRQYYSQVLQGLPDQNLPRGKSNVPGKIARNIHTDISLNTDGTSVAIVTNDHGRYDIWTFTFENANVRHIYSGGVKVLNQLPDYEFPKVNWNPGNGELYFITYEKDNYLLMRYHGGKVRKEFVFKDYSDIRDFSFSTDGKSMVFSGVKNGKNDLYLYSFEDEKHNIQRLTNDLYFDAGAMIRDDGSILFISNRPENMDSVKDFTNAISNVYELRSGKINALTHFINNNQISSLISYSGKKFGFISDISGLNNAYAIDPDSGFTVYPQTNYKFGILNQSVSHDQRILVELLVINGIYNIFTSNVSPDPVSEAVKTQKLRWKKSIENLDSLFADRNVRITSRYLTGNDSISLSRVDSTNRNYTYQTGFPKVDYSMNGPEDSAITETQFKRSHFYNALQPDYLLSQSENRVLGSYLFNNNINREALRNPLIMPYLKVSLADVLKNYVIEAGFRTSLDLLITDYISRFALLKYRYDHEFTLSRHMRKFDDEFNNLKQNISIQGAYTLSYPINEKMRLSAQAGSRYEFITIKGSESQNLDIPDIKDYYLTGNFSFLFDNTTSLGLNMMRGTRALAGFDIYKKLGTNYTINNIVADLRFYLPVYQKIIWANRVSCSYSIGNGKVAYFLGGVENWTTKNQFAPFTPQLNNDPYLFQQWVSNLRGFYRGVRIGSSFAILNSELRFPVFQTLVKRPLESEFLKHFTVNVFVDAGTAFIGRSTSDPNNLFNTIYYSTPNYDISITSSRNPFVMGLGYGVRTRFLGYFVKFDRGYGKVENTWQTPVNYISLGFDF